ncbi:hypothetical protein MASR2M15_24770 [Anaerolineales bacterium]
MPKLLLVSYFVLHLFSLTINAVAFNPERTLMAVAYSDQIEIWGLQN